MPKKRSDDEDFDVGEIISLIKKDPKYKKFVRVVETAEQRLNLEKDREEAMALHASRLSRNIRGERRYSPKNLIDASLTDLSTRARLVEIRVKASMHAELLGDACDAIKRHVFTEYLQHLRVFSNESQRSAFAKRVQGRAQSVLIESQSLLDLLDILIKDIDQSSHFLRNVVESMKLLDSSKGKVI